MDGIYGRLGFSVAVRCAVIATGFDSSRSRIAKLDIFPGFSDRQPCRHQAELASSWWILLSNAGPRISIPAGVPLMRSALTRISLRPFAPR